MGRNRISKSEPDRYLAKINGYWNYHHRVPSIVADQDDRAPVVRMSLKTADLMLARKKRDMLEEADEALWASMIVNGVTDPARRRYDSAVKRVEALGFTFHSGPELDRLANFDDLRRRLLEGEGHAKDDVVGLPIIGAVPVPRTTIKDAFKIYVDEIVADELIGKSAVQRAQWKKVKLRAVENFVRLVADKAMVDITADDARTVYKYWVGRIAPKEGAATATASSGNRDVGNLRVLYEAYFRHMGEMNRPNPFAGFGFTAKKKRSRPPIPTEWIRGRILAPGALATMNSEARGILLIMIETGARPSEICNLEATSIRLSHKVPHLSIEPRDDPDDPREIKTESSRRQVPLVGVALAAAQANPAGFPNYRNRENDLSATINKYLRTNGLFPSRGHTLYSFRHAFEDRMKEGDLDEELRRILMGHTIDRPRYGSGGSLDWRRKQMLKIALPFANGII